MPRLLRLVAVVGFVAVVGLTAACGPSGPAGAAAAGASTTPATVSATGAVTPPADASSSETDAVTPAETGGAGTPSSAAFEASATSASVGGQGQDLATKGCTGIKLSDAQALVKSKVTKIDFDAGSGELDPAHQFECQFNDQAMLVTVNPEDTAQAVDGRTRAAHPDGCACSARFGQIGSPGPLDFINPVRCRPSEIPSSHDRCAR